ATEKVLRRLVPREQVGDETVEAERAVVRREMHGRPRRTEIVDAGRQLRRPHAVVERDAPDAASRGLAGVTAFAEQFANVSEKRRLADAAGDEGGMLASQRFGEAVAQ